jgi:hypothetical protein
MAKRVSSSQLVIKKKFGISAPQHTIDISQKPLRFGCQLHGKARRCARRGL